MRTAGARGSTLFELLLVVVIMGIVFTAAVPRSAVAFEEARVDGAAATLRSIWSAQRLHWLERHSYAASLGDLSSLLLIEPGVASETKPFDYAITTADATTFTAQATRSGSTWWSGSLAVDETSAITGTITDGDGRDVVPSQD